MKIATTLSLAAVLCCGLFVCGCETSHSESTKPGMFGGEKHEETTTYKNPVTGDTSTSHSETKTP